MRIAVTGSSGFIGKNLLNRLALEPNHEVVPVNHNLPANELGDRLAESDIVVHLGGVNRPLSGKGFRAGNVDYTATICERLISLGMTSPILFASSIQATIDNDYGISKRQAEELVTAYSRDSGAPVIIYRLANVFGKWCRPNYNSVVATFCHNTSNGLPITISNPAQKLNLIHVDDVVESFVQEINSHDQASETVKGELVFRDAGPQYQVTLQRLAELLQSFRDSRRTLDIPDFADPFTHTLYGTYLSYLAEDDFGYDLVKHSDPRGSLAEFVKSKSAGQIFVSRTKPGVTRGNHYHNNKTEKFLVLAGEAIVRFRHIQGNKILEYPVRGEDFRVVDIPTGYTHSIENTGKGELVTLFWASEIFRPEQPDTNRADV
jgi:UDP-2-acetamido-2,6-beta-L-arabino-hexul-4-ose reductase